jgi:putative DNA methylase
MTGKLPNRSLLDEGDLPVVGLSRLAHRETVRPRDVYGSHKWFARRLAVTARSLLVAAGTPAGGSFWKSYYQAPSYEGRNVLDPFLGGGVMLLEASRLGADVYGIDVEPVAAAISSFQGRLRTLPPLETTLETICETVGAELAPYYRSRDNEGSDETLLHAFWVQVVRCGECRYEFHAHPQFRLASDSNIDRQWIVCRGCGEVSTTKCGSKTTGCACGIRTDGTAGRVDSGKAVCPSCGNRQKLIDQAAATGGVPKFHMFAVETIPAGPERRYTGASRRIRAATSFDRKMFDNARQALALLKAEMPDAIASSPIPRQGRKDDRLLRYGYENYSELFSARQQLHLALLAKAIENLEGPVREAFSIAFSDHLITNNFLCSYAADWRRLSPLFSIRAFRHIARPVEINPWLRKNGRGTFPNAVRSVQRAAAALADPYEPTRAGSVRSVQDHPQGTRDLRCGDAKNLSHLPDASIDLVLTDPPYFDYISYSELGHFFVPWLVRFGLVSADALTSFPAEQMAAGSRSPAAIEQFTDGMAKAFKEIRRVCREGARIVFTYQNLDGHGWTALAKGMADGGVCPIKAFPLLGDCGSRLHKRERSVSWDAVVVCRVDRPGCWSHSGKVDPDIGSREARTWARKVQGAGLDFTDSDEINIAYALSLVVLANTGMRPVHELESPRRRTKRA